MKRKRRGSSRFFFLFIFIGGLIGLSFWGMKSILSKVEWFEIKKIEITGHKNLEAAYLANLSKDVIGKNLFSISEKQVQLKYDNIIRIKKIKIKKIIPTTLRIKIDERDTIFYIKTTDGMLFPIDEERIVLDNDMFYSTEIAPVISTSLSTDNVFYGEKIFDQFIEKIFQFYNEIQEIDDHFMSKISEFYPQDGDVCFVEINTGYRVIFAEDNKKDQIARFNFIEENRNFAQNSIVDLRFSNQLIIQSEDN